MSKYSYTPEVLEQIQAVCKDPSILIYDELNNTEVEIEFITEFLKNICSFLKKNVAEIGALEYLLELNFDKKSIGSPLTAAKILSSITNDNKVIEINSNLSIVSNSKLFDFSNSGIASYSRANKCTTILIHNGTDLTIYVNGFPAKEININYPTSSARVNKKLARTSKEYKISLLDFYENRVKVNQTGHWENKQKRILKGGKTEDIFQDSLANWLWENISDAIIYSKVNKISGDETDIEIRSHGGNNYLIEIKWLGQNQSSTTYDESRIRDSIHQVKNYLDIEPDILDATIVVYDGRSLEKFEKIKCSETKKGEWKFLKECQKKHLPLKGGCYVFFLISESASVRKN